MSIQGVPFALLLLRPLWMMQSRPAMFVLIGLLVGVSLIIAARAFRARNFLAVAIGWVLLVISEGVVGVTDEFSGFYDGMGLVYALFFVDCIGGLVLTSGIIRSLMNVAPPLRLASGLQRRLGMLAYRLVSPAFLAMPLVWMTLNQLRRLSYPLYGGEPNEFYSLVIKAQDYVWWMILVLLPFACGVAIHSLVRKKRTALAA